MEVVISEGKRNLKISVDIDGIKSYIENIDVLISGMAERDTFEDD